ncbi:macrophage mannose receptor 1-like [Neoarius graeffei]|uniref:macrophage mannose receptor 1-like n=1 Tax=Neoarius graeffei TaxID=443677 RepID=UPI00298D2BB6|nr:macrophage mannose receptor 1-like [Neoarius graeffei]
MKLNLFFLLCLTGLLSISVSILQTVPHSYDLIMTQMTWPDAQKYCRVMYDDLATILSITDWIRFKNEAASKGLRNFAWVGLYSDIYNWRWSLNDLPLKNVPFSNWYPGQPDNYYRNELCTIIAGYNQWYDIQCTTIRAFICYNANFSGAAKFIGINSPRLTWPEAQAYCRTHHTDLASSLNSSDNDMLVKIKIAQGDSWIGLYRDMETWKWTDGTSASNIPWQPGQPNNYYGRENCAMLYTSNGLFQDDPCTTQRYFFCHTSHPTRRHIVRLQVKSDGSVLDPAEQSYVLEQIKQKLKDSVMLENTTVTWTVQPDGTIFHKKKKDGL